MAVLKSLQWWFLILSLSSCHWKRTPPSGGTRNATGSIEKVKKKESGWAELNPTHPPTRSDRHGAATRPHVDRRIWTMTVKSLDTAPPSVCRVGQNPSGRTNMTSRGRRKEDIPKDDLRIRSISLSSGWIRWPPCSSG